MLKNNYNFKLNNSINSNSKNMLLYKNYLIQIQFLFLIKLTYLPINNKNIS